MSPPGFSFRRLRFPALLLGHGLMARIGLRVRSDPRRTSARPEPSAGPTARPTPPVDPYLERILRARQHRPLEGPPWVDRLDERIAVMDAHTAPTRPDRA